MRAGAGIGWPGGAYPVEVVLADVELDGELSPSVLHVAVGRAGLVFLFALGEGATWRVLGTRPAGTAHTPFGQPGEAVPVPDVQRLLDDAGLGVRVRTLAWSARVPLQHRFARHFRKGPISSPETPPTRTRPPRPRA